ncbi:hypothetical protein J7L60_03400 [Candidatus Bathyarchaeota archaeon]|nr:hypothetical protein [Candidatus Bathyarchaeota archaeon]
MGLLLVVRDMKMRSRLSIASAEISVFSYSTEDEEKVRRAVLNILPQELGESLRFSSSSLRGHYNDRILILRAEVREGTTGLAHHLLRRLSPGDQRRLLDEVERRMDGSGNLYIRLNKQEALLGRLELGDADPIWVKLKFRSRGRRVSARSVKEALSALLGGAVGIGEQS